MTGEEAEIPERRVVRFKPGKHFKNAVNGQGLEDNRPKSKQP